MAPKIAIVFYSMYGHIKTLAQAEKEGIEKAGVTVDLYQIPETLSDEVLAKMGAPPKDKDIPFLENPATLEGYDGFLLGIPTRYGNFPAQWKTFWDKTGKQWGAGGYHGKLAGLFISTGSLGGGQESTALAAMSTFAHHGIIYVPFGYAKAFQTMTDLSEVHGGGPWGAGTFAGGDGSRQPSAKEIEIAKIQGEEFAKTVLKYSSCLHNETKDEQGATRAAVKAPGGAGEDAVRSEVPAEPKQMATTPGKYQTAQEDSVNTKAGPCGLPKKCTVL